MIDMNPLIKEFTIRYKIKNLYAITLVVLMSSSLFSCTSQGTGILGQQTLSDTDENADIKNAPFAYDLVPDTISYNACVMQPSVIDPTLHGLKIGVSEGFVDTLGTGTVKGGVKLNTNFLNYVGQKFTPEYPSNTITPAQVAKILNQNYSVFNSGALIQFAVRRKSDFAIIPDLITTASDTVSYAPRDASVFLQTLSAGFLGYSLTKSIEYDSRGTFLRQGPRVYNLSDTEQAVPIEGSFNFNASADTSNNTPSTLPTEPYAQAEIYSQTVRDRFNTNAQILTATFGGSGSTTGNPADDVTNNTLNNIKRPYKNGTTNFDATKAYGRGYILKFDSASTVSTWPKSLLTRVDEINLEGGSPPTANWFCEQIVIADQKHWNNNRANNYAWVFDTTYTEPNCAPLLPSDMTTERTNRIKRIRRHYAVSDWNIGLMFPAKLKSTYAGPPDRANLELCISPRTTTSCYLPTVGILASADISPVTKLPINDVGIQYDRTQECYLTMATVTGSRDEQRKKGRCAQYASICTRSSPNF